MKSTEVEPVVDRTFELGENPLWFDERGVYLWTDITAGRLWEYDRGTGAVRCRYQGPPVGGFTIQHDGSLLLFRVDDIAILDPGDGVRVIAPFEDDRAVRFNDVIAAPDGSVLAGTIGRDDSSGGVYHLARDGTLRPLFHRTGISNGMGFSPDLRTLYWTCSTTREIWRFDYDAREGLVDVASAARIFRGDRSDPGGAVPDGLTVDAAGDLWSARWEGSCVVRHAADGRVLGRVGVPTPKVTSVTFGGPDLDELLITTSGGPVYRCHPGARGRREFRSAIE